MKKFILVTLILSVLFSSTFSLSANAIPTEPEDKVIVSFESLSDEDLAEITADSDSYDVSVMIEFSYDKMDLSVVEDMELTERRATVAEYYKTRNEAIADDLNFDRLSVSYFAPYAELLYDDLEEYNYNSEYIYEISEDDRINRICVDVLDYTNDTESVRAYGDGREYSLSQALIDVGIENSTYTGEGIKVGTIDAGAPDITSHISNSITTYGSTFDNHCSIVTGVIGTVASGVELYCVGLGDLIIDMNTNWTIALNWLIGEKGVHIINISYGVLSSQLAELDDEDKAIYDMMSAHIDYVIDTTGCTIIKSAGNNGDKIGQPKYGLINSPGFSSNSVTVGSSSKDKLVSVFSSFICNTPQLNKPDLVAPGENLTPIPGTSDAQSGTSLSTPIVTGIVARLMQEYPTLKTRPILLKAVLMESCTKLTHQESELNYYAGAGLVNYANARDILADFDRSYYVLHEDIVTGLLFNPIIPAGETLRVRLCIGIDGVASIIDADEPTDINISQYTVSVKSTDLISTYTSVTFQSSTAYITYTNNTSSDMIVTVVVMPQTSGYTGEVVACTHNMESNHYHSYGSWTVYTSSMHRKYCSCGNHISEAHDFVSSGNVLVCSDCNYRKTTGGPVIEPWGIQTFDDE